MKILKTSALDALLKEASNNVKLDNNIRTLSKEYETKDAIEWDDLRRIAQAIEAVDGNAPQLHQLCRGGGLFLEPPPPRQSSKSPELQAHLDKLRAKLEQDKYNSMVEDVTANERAAEQAAEGGLNTYKQQISFGIHVLAMMAGFYVFGHVAGMAITSNKVYHPAVGLIFMFFAMILETVLFVVRTTVPPKLHWEMEQWQKRRRAVLLEESKKKAESIASEASSSSAQTIEQKKLN